MPKFNSTIEGPAVAPRNAPLAEASPSQPQPAVSRLSFGGITKKKETKTSYPVLPDANGQAAIIAARIMERTGQLEALEGALETDKAELKLMALPFYFTQASGKAEVPSSISVPSPAGEVLVTFTSRYKALESDAALLPVLGQSTGQFFKQSFTLKIDGDKLPAAGAQSLLDELQALFARHNATDALSVTEGIKPVPDFHAKRHLVLTPQQNLTLEQICPMVAMIKTKGRR